MLRVRSTLARSIRAYFDRQSFFEVNTPIITGNDCEGGGETFMVSTSEGPAQSSTRGAPRSAFFNTDVHLTVSGECFI